MPPTKRRPRVFPFRHALRRGAAAAITVAALAFALTTRADIASLTVVGPNSGSAFSNLGSVAQAGPLPSMARAEVTILLKPGRGDDLTAECKASFEMLAGPEQIAPLLVAFPVTGTHGDAVKVTGFEVTVNGGRVHGFQYGAIRLTAPPDAKHALVKLPTHAELLRKPWDNVPGSLSGDGHLYPTTYYWEQTFAPNQSTHIEITYELTLHPQELHYRKERRRGSSLDVVPFELLGIETGGKAYLFDYVLRSGATWGGPIGYEKVTLTATPETNLDLTSEDIAIVGRKVARYFRDDTEARERSRAGLVPAHVRQTTSSIVWEIHNETPTEDILIQIPLALRRNAK